MERSFDLEWLFSGKGLSGTHRLLLPDGESLSAEFVSCYLSDAPNLTDGECGIYSIDPGQGRIYVGSSVDVLYRILRHRSHLRLGKHANAPLLKAYQAARSTVVRVIVLTGRDEIKFIEQLALDRWFDSGKLFNRSPSSTSCAGTIHTDESKLRMSEVAKTRVVDEGTRLKISATLKGRKLSGRQLDTLTRVNKTKWGDPSFRDVWGLAAKRPVIIEGVIYDSLTAAATAHEVTAGRVRARILSENPKFKEWRYMNELSTRKQRSTTDAKV